MNVLLDFVSFFKNPILEKDENQEFTYKIQVFFLLLFGCFAISFFLSIIIGMLYSSGLIENDYHAFDKLKQLPAYQVFLTAAVIGPFIEEILFRAPLVLFKSPLKLYVYLIPFSKQKIEFPKIEINAFKNPNVFRYAFYGCTIAFGFMHLMNYQIDTQIIIFSPILVAPQLILGLIFGYVRVRLGLVWAIAMHATYNGILVSLALLAKDVVPQ